MDLEGLRRLRRILSAVVSISAVALVMARTAGDATPSAPGIGLGAAGVFLVSLAALTLVWRKEHAASEEAFAARERAQLAMLRLQAELTKKKATVQEGPTEGT